MADMTIDREETCEVIYWGDLTETEQSDFDYLDTPERQSDASFARYRGATYDLGGFMVVSEPAPFLPRWQGYASDTYFSGILIRYTDDCDAVVMATYCT